MSSSSLRWQRRPTLRRPVLLAAFEGWSDAGDSATLALNHLAGRWSARPFADIDPEDYFDFTSTRPHVRLVNGLHRKIEWPRNEFSAGTFVGGERDVIVLQGSEPQLRWRAFCGHILDVVRAYDVEMVVTLGALLADVPHTRPVRITGTAADGELVDRLGLMRSRYEGPTGIVGVLHDFLGTAGIRSASLWGAVPHYLPGTPSPKAALALVERTAELLGTTVTTLDLQIASADYENQVNEVVDADDEMRGFVRELEASHDDGDDDDDVEIEDESPDSSPEGAVPGALTDEHGNVPSGDALAAELEQFLRDQS